MAYTSSAIPSMLAPNNSLNIDLGVRETTWMSKQTSSFPSFFFAHISPHFRNDREGQKEEEKMGEKEKEGEETDYVIGQTASVRKRPRESIFHRQPRLFDPFRP